MVQQFRRCAHCEEAFRPTRRTAQFCSARCRVAAHRVARRLLDPPPARVRLTADEVYLLKEGLAYLLDEAQPDVQALYDRLVEIHRAMEQG